MRRQYPYKGYTIHVEIDGFHTPRLRPFGMAGRGFSAHLTITRQPAHTRLADALPLFDDDGLWFACDSDALMAACVAGQRLVDAQLATES